MFDRRHKCLESDATWVILSYGSCSGELVLSFVSKSSKGTAMMISLSTHQFSQVIPVYGIPCSCDKTILSLVHK